MIQRVHATDDVELEIAELIGNAVRPWRVVLFGSRARGSASDGSDYDIYVELNSAADRAALKEHERLIRAALNGKRWYIDLKVRPRGEIERRRDDPGTIEWDVAREGRILFAASAAARTMAPAARVREPHPEPPESVQEWLRAADHDIRHAEMHQHAIDEYAPEICWLSHQAVEKFMKALLVANRVRPARTHDLVKLLSALRASGQALPGLDEDCRLLTTHAILPRYPAGLDLGVEDATAAFAAAQRVVAAVRHGLPPAIH
ncbi:MAG: HEPN domain-containing protein [Gemmatimonadaceae bacterium]